MLSNSEINKTKEELKQNVFHVHNFEDVNDLLYYCFVGRYVIFDSIILKNYFVNNTNRNVINCNSSYEKFTEEMEKYFDDKTIFNNINFCNDVDILNIVNKTNNLMID